MSKYVRWRIRSLIQERSQYAVNSIGRRNINLKINMLEDMYPQVFEEVMIELNNETMERKDANA